MDYAARLSAAGQTLDPTTAETLAGQYAAYLTGLGQPQGGGGGFKLSAANANVTPDQQSILDAIVAMYNSAPRVS